MNEQSPIQPSQPTSPELAKKLTYTVKCDWCGAEPNKPCVDNHGRVLPFGIMHRCRRKDFKPSHGGN